MHKYLVSLGIYPEYKGYYYIKYALENKIKSLGELSKHFPNETYSRLDRNIRYVIQQQYDKMSHIVPRPTISSLLSNLIENYYGGNYE